MFKVKFDGYYIFAPMSGQPGLTLRNFEPVEQVEQVEQAKQVKQLYQLNTLNKLTKLISLKTFD